MQLRLMEGSIHCLYLATSSLCQLRARLRRSHSQCAGPRFSLRGPMPCRRQDFGRQRSEVVSSAPTCPHHEGPRRWNAPEPPSGRSRTSAPSQCPRDLRNGKDSAPCSQPICFCWPRQCAQDPPSKTVENEERSENGCPPFVASASSSPQVPGHDPTPFTKASLEPRGAFSCKAFASSTATASSFRSQMLSSLNTPKDSTTFRSRHLISTGGLESFCRSKEGCIGATKEALPHTCAPRHSLFSFNRHQVEISLQEHLSAPAACICTVQKAPEIPRTFCCRASLCCEFLYQNGLSGPACRCRLP